MLKILYDIDAADENDQRIALVEDVLESVAQGVVPGKFLVEFFPFLRHVPAWVPGAGFQALFAGWREAAELMRCEPFELVKRSMVSQPLSCFLLFQSLNHSRTRRRARSALLRAVLPPVIIPEGSLWRREKNLPRMWAS